MPGRRKIHLPLTEMGEEVGLCVNENGDPIMAGDGSIDEDLVCGLCHRTLFLALNREGVFSQLEKDGWPTTSHGRRLPLLAVCDCGAFNRLWPIPID
jgi:hypothetical protein